MLVSCQTVCTSIFIPLSLDSVQGQAWSYQLHSSLLHSRLLRPCLLGSRTRVSHRATVHPDRRRDGGWKRERCLHHSTRFLRCHLSQRWRAEAKVRKFKLGHVWVCFNLEYIVLKGYFYIETEICYKKIKCQLA